MRYQSTVRKDNFKKSNKIKKADDVTYVISHGPDKGWEEL